MKCKLKFLMLFVVVMGFVALLHAEETEKRMLLYTPYTKISVPPGETINYSIDVVNNTEGLQTPDIYVMGIPHGWKSEMKSGSYIVNQLAVMPNDKKTFNLQVTVPLQVNRGTYRFVVHAGNEAELPLSVMVSSQGTYKTEFTTDQPNMQGNSKSNFNFNANLNNKTAETQLYALIAAAPRGWNVIFRANGKQATSAQVEPNSTENISIEITPPGNVEAGTYKIPIKATTGSASGELELEVVVTGSYDMELTTPRGLLSSDITAGDTKRIDLVVNNTGSAELKDVRLSSSKPEGWEVSFEPTAVETLKAGESVDVQAVVRASKKAIPGDYVMNISANTPETGKSVSFRMTVKTPLLWGWIGIGIIVVVCGTIFYLFRKYGRR
ncbi:MAG: hypothetical protein BGO33_10695 [Bacteroidia bacterium 43-41]|nr:MAG: hypothetical protein BGO33_10695 [Bacteroidia bacterium 43-41]